MRSLLFFMSLVFITMISGCANIPVATLFELSSFDENAFVALKPEDIRTKIQLDAPVEVNVAETRLSLQLETNKGERQFTYPLILVAETKLAEEETWFSSMPARTQYELALAPDGIKAFNAVQASIQLEKPTNFAFGVNAKLKEHSMINSEVVLTILLKLTTEKDYLTLIDRATFEVTLSD